MCSLHLHRAGDVLLTQRSLDVVSDLDCACLKVVASLGVSRGKSERKTMDYKHQLGGQCCESILQPETFSTAFLLLKGFD